MAKKHDLIIIHLQDIKETRLPRLGIVPMVDTETQKVNWVNTSSYTFQKRLKEKFIENQNRLKAFCRQYKCNYLSIQTDADIVAELIKLFKVRNRKIKSE